jgi:hypothetical protein
MCPLGARQLQPGTGGEGEDGVAVLLFLFHVFMPSTVLTLKE